MAKTLRETQLPLSDNALTVLERRYLKKDADGRVIERPEDLFRRVADNIAQADGNYGADQRAVAATADAFYGMMTRLEFMPNSPTLMNAGREFQQLSACFVLPVEDSMESIFDAVKNTAMIHKSGGGTGFSFSRLRPANDIVSSTRGVSSGPISFMRVFDAATEAIKQGGVRRGANMGVLRVDHPDIMAFIEAKADHTTLTNFNLSVGVTDEFMRALQGGESFDLINPRTGEKVGALDAREVFRRMAEQAWAGGDPGVIFLDRINAANPTPLVGEIEATNPCLSGDTWVTTAEFGPRQVARLVGTPVHLLLDGQWHRTSERGFFSTGVQQLFLIETHEGYSLKATAGHHVPVRRGADETKLLVSELQPGDELLLSRNVDVSWDGPGTSEEGYLLGYLLGDGNLHHSDHRAVLQVIMDEDDKQPTMVELERCAGTLRHRSDFRGFQAEIQGRRCFELKSTPIYNLAIDYGMRSGKAVTTVCEEASSDFCIGFLRGLFDADGTVIGNCTKGFSVRLWQHDLAGLYAVQRMLARLGIESTVYADRKGAGRKSLPDGKGDRRLYGVTAGHELVMNAAAALEYRRLIGFTHAGKQRRLEAGLAAYVRGPYRPSGTARVKSITPLGSEEVFDCQVPGANRFDANGIVVGNCGEQPLLPYESCNLGSINLAQMVSGSGQAAQIDWDRLREVVHLAVHFLDNVIDMNRLPLPQIAEMTRANRKIGLGVMGFADMLILLGIPYNSQQSVRTAEEVMKFVRDQARAASRQLAQERGAFPNWEGSTYQQAGEAPLRNATVTTIAPTGTISMIAGCSSGIEPLFAVVFTRHVLDGDELLEVHPIFERLARERGCFSPELMREIAAKGTVRDISAIPEDVREIFITAHDVTPEWHVRLQAAFQEFTDNAVSKTVNFPNEATVDDVEHVYRMAYELGCKGVTIYRDGSREEQVLTTGKTERARVPELQPVVPRPRARPAVVTGSTRAMRTGCGKLYVTINRDERGPFELFATMGKAGGCAASQTEAIARLVSLAFRCGIPPEEVMRQLRGIRCHQPAWEAGGRQIVSCADAVAKAIEDYLMPEGEQLALDFSGSSFGHLGACPECGGTLVHDGGCNVCRDCGYSQCA